MDGREEEIIMRLCCGVAATVVIILVAYFNMIFQRPRPIPYEPSIFWECIGMHICDVS